MIINKFDGAVFLASLKRMVKYSRQKVFFVTHDHLLHKTEKVQAWLKENKRRVEVFFIPLYRSELNAQEHLNQDVKTNVIGKKWTYETKLYSMSLKEKSRIYSPIYIIYLRPGSVRIFGKIIFSVFFVLSSKMFFYLS